MSALQPRTPTQADLLLERFPNANGKGITVAVFDTGVDPGAVALQRTPDGRPKVVDLVDATGAGDVDMRKIVRSTAGGSGSGITVVGLSGKTLTLSSRWSNPSGDWRVGTKRIVELFPRGLKPRDAKDRARVFDESQSAAVAAADHALARFEAINPVAATSAAESPLKLEHAELTARIAVLKDLGGSVTEVGPILDCVVWHDGSALRAVIDREQSGDLSSQIPMTNYRAERQYLPLVVDERVELNFAVNIYDGGEVLSIVTDSGAHGTHVAGTIGAFDAENADLNGVAPGVQIVGIKIGDNRLGSMETGTGMARAAIACIENKCDLINMSFGEPSGLVGVQNGRITTLYKSLVQDHGVIFVTSAGNAGPALSTVGAPASSCNEWLLSVGAYVSADMMREQYALRSSPVPEINFTWSSRGPTRDGQLGVSFCAPGGAISSVPTWTLRRNQHMNGTSMAAPNACGGIALILSALRLAGLPRVSPTRVRRALECTAREIAGVEWLSQGNGLLQLNDAYDHIVAFQKYAALDTPIKVSIPSRAVCPGSGSAAGIYLREPAHSLGGAKSFKVFPSPSWSKETPQKVKLAFDQRVILRCSAPWVSCSSEYNFASDRGFEIRVDPEQLEAGALATCQLEALDPKNPEAGPLFRVPIVVVKPNTLPEGTVATVPERMVFTPGHLERRYFAVPAGATWVDFIIKADNVFSAGDDVTDRRLHLIHAQQLLAHTPHRESMLEQYLWMTPGAQKCMSMKIEGGGTLEVVLGQFWNSLENSAISIQTVFHGLAPSNAAPCLTAGDRVCRIDATVGAALRAEILGPSASLTHASSSARPTKATIRPLSATRDVLPSPSGGQIYALDLVYSFDLKADCTAQILVSSVDQMLYDSPLMAQLCMVFDRAEKLVGYSDFKGSAPYNMKLKKGPTTVKVQLRSDDPALLAKLKGIVVTMKRKLAKPVALGVYASLPAAAVASPGFKQCTVQPGASQPFWLATPDLTAKTMPDGTAAGDVLSGTLSLAKPNSTAPGQGKRPEGYPVSWVLPAPLPAAPSAPVSEPADDGDADTAAKEDESALDALLKEAVRDAKIAALAKLKPTSPLTEPLRIRLAAEFPDDLVVQEALLKSMDRADWWATPPPSSPSSDDSGDAVSFTAAAAAVVTQADGIIAGIATQHANLAAVLGLNLAEGATAAEKKEREAMTKVKTLLKEAHLRKGKALAFLVDTALNGGDGADASAASASAAGSPLGTLKQTWIEMQRWFDVSKPEFQQLLLRMRMLESKPAAALQILAALIGKDAKEDKKLKTMQIALLAKCGGFEHILERAERSLVVEYPEKGTAPLF